MKKMELMRRIEPFKRTQADKEKVQLSSVGGSDRKSRLRRQKLTVLTKWINPRPIFIKAVEVINSDE